MIRENEFCRDQSRNLTPEESFELRQNYRRLPKHLKKSMSRDLTKHKQNLSFEEWFIYIGQRVKEGGIIHRKNSNNVSYSDEYDHLKEQVRDPKWREYAGHRFTDVE